MGKWYVEILTGDRLAQDGADLYPISWNWTENINEAQALDMTIAYDSRITSGKYFYLRNDENDAAWFYGIIKEVSAQFESPQGQIMSFTSTCIMDELTEYDVGKLGIHQSGVGDPFQARRIAFAGPSADTGFIGTDIDVELPNLIDNDTGTTFAWPMWTGDGNTKDGKGIDAIYFVTRVPIYDAIFDTSVGSGYGTPTSKDVKFEYLRQGTDGAGWTNAGVSINAVTDPDVTAFQTAGTITININNDLSGTIVKSSQSDTYGFWYRLWIESGEVQSQGNMTIRNIRVNKRVAVDDAIGKIITPITGWTTTDTDTADPVYLELDGGNALKALRVVAKMTGGLFRNGSTSSNQLSWIQSSTGGATSGVTLDEDNILLGGLSARFIDPSATRYTFHGAGIGQNRITAALQDVYAVSPSTFTFDGDTYQYDPSTNILVNQTAETDIGRVIHKSIDIPYISSLYASGQSIDASNQLIRMAVRALSKASKRNRTAYTVKVCNITSRIPVGDKVQLVYTNTSHTVNAEFVVTSIKRSFNGLTTFTYELSSDGFFIDADSGRIEESLIETIDKKIQRQPMSAVDLEGATTGGGGGGEVAGDNLGNHVAEIDLDMGANSVTNVNLVDGVDVSQLKTDHDSHVANTSNPHNVTAAQVGALTAPVAFSEIEDVNQNTLTGRIAAGTGPQTDLSATQARTILNIEDGANNYIHPNHSGDVISTGDGATTIPNDTVTYAKMQNMSTNNRILGRFNAGSGDIEELAAGTVRTILNVEDGAEANDPTNLSYNSSTRQVESSTGTNATIPLATASIPGLMNGADVTKLGTIETGAQVNPTFTDNAFDDPGDPLDTDGAGRITFQKVAAGANITPTIAFDGKASASDEEVIGARNTDNFLAAWMGTENKDGKFVLTNLVGNDRVTLLGRGDYVGYFVQSDGSKDGLRIQRGNATVTGNAVEVMTNAGIVDSYWSWDGELSGIKAISITARSWDTVNLASAHTSRNWQEVSGHGLEVRLSVDGDIAYIRGRVERTTGSDTFLQDSNILTAALGTEYRPSREYSIAVLGAGTSGYNRPGRLRVLTTGHIQFSGDQQSSTEDWDFYGSWPVG